MLYLPPEKSARWKLLSATLKELKTDVQRLWKRMPQRPDSPRGEIGIGNVPDFGTLGSMGTVNTGLTQNTFNTFNTTGTVCGNASCGSCGTSMPCSFSITMSGIGTGTGCAAGNCTGFNTTFTLVPGATGYTTICRHDSVETSPCGVGSGKAFILFFASSTWFIRMLGADGAILKEWSLASASFDCDGDNVFSETALTPSGRCTGYPTTVTLEPVL